MRVPERLEPLLEQGVIDEVIRPLMSGKEAEIFLVIADGEERVAKVYKDARFRSFQHRAQYTEGRRVRSSREQRAMNKGSRHGRAKTEEAWRSAEVDAIQVLRGAGVRVPRPYAYVEGVLVMELVRGFDGGPAPRMVDVQFTREEATELFHLLVREVVKMLCAGIVHADLSDFNVLLSAEGPVIIDFPQAIDPARNQSAKKLLLRDVKNLAGFLGRFAPELRRTRYGPEMWSLYERSELDPETELTGKYKEKKVEVEVNSLLEDILKLEQEARERREALGLPPPRTRRPVVRSEASHKPQTAPGDRPPRKRRRRRGRGGVEGGGPGQGNQQRKRNQQDATNQQRPQKQQGPGPRLPKVQETQQTVGEGTEGAPKKRRRRRRRRRGRGGSGNSGGGGE